MQHNPLLVLDGFERVVYDKFVPMTGLLASAGMTQRIGLIPPMMLGPIRGGGVLAKQVAQT